MGSGRQHTADRRAGGFPRLPMVERDRELQVLTGEAAAATAGARLVLLTGEAGAGKSRLAEEFAATLPETWGTIRTGAPFTERTVGAPFDHLVGPIPERGDPAAALADGLAAAIGEAASAGPVLVTIEDLHWIDPTGVWALGPTLDRLLRAPVLLVATFRLGSHRLGSEHSGALAALARHPRCTELRLPPLSIHAIAELVRTDEPEAVAGIHRRTGGNPFFVEALVQARPGAAVDWTVAEIVRQQLGELGDRDRRLVELLAVTAAPVPFDVYADALREESDVGTGAAFDHGPVVAIDDDHVALRHGIVGEAVRQGLGIAARRDLHRRLASAYSAQPDPGRFAEALAQHWAAAGDSERAAPWALAAADRLLTRRAYPSAARLYRMALVHPPAEGARARGALFERAALAAAMGGDPDSARAWAAEAGGAPLSASRRGK